MLESSFENSGSALLLDWRGRLTLLVGDRIGEFWNSAGCEGSSSRNVSNVFDDSPMVLSRAPLCVRRRRGDFKKPSSTGCWCDLVRDDRSPRLLGDVCDLLLPSSETVSNMAREIDSVLEVWLIDSGLVETVRVDSDLSDTSRGDTFDRGLQGSSISYSTGDDFACLDLRLLSLSSLTGDCRDELGLEREALMAGDCGSSDFHLERVFDRGLLLGEDESTLPTDPLLGSSLAEERPDAPGLLCCESDLLRVGFWGDEQPSSLLLERQESDLERDTPAGE